MEQGDALLMQKNKERKEKKIVFVRKRGMQESKAIRGKSYSPVKISSLQFSPSSNTKHTYKTITRQMQHVNVGKKGSPTCDNHTHQSFSRVHDSMDKSAED